MDNSEEKTITQTEETATEPVQLHILVAGAKEDAQLKEKLEALGHKVSFLALELPPLETNIGFKHLKPAMDQAKKENMDLVLGVDQEHQRLSMAVRKTADGPFLLLNIHQITALLTSILFEKYDKDTLTFVPSHHISAMIEKMVGVSGYSFAPTFIPPGKYVEVLSQKVEEAEGEPVMVTFTENQEIHSTQDTFIDLVAELVALAAESRQKGETLFETLIHLYERFGFYKEKTFMVDFVTPTQKKHILKNMDDIRKLVASARDRLGITKIEDFKKGKSKNLLTQKELKLSDSGIDVVSIELEEGERLTMAPQDDKMYYYLSVRGGLSTPENFSETNQSANERMIQIMEVINSL